MHYQIEFASTMVFIFDQSSRKLHVLTTVVQKKKKIFFLKGTLTTESSSSTPEKVTLCYGNAEGGATRH